jgi:hypothetical protein
MANQGIDHTDDYVIFWANLATVNFFFVRNWSFGTPAAAQGGPLSGLLLPGFQYLNIVHFPDPNDSTSWINPTSYKWRYQEVHEQQGIEGQGPNQNPASVFSNHQMVFFNGTYYDPSYGTTFPSAAAFEDQAIQAYALAEHKYLDETSYGIDFDNDGDTNDPAVSVITFSIVPNPPGNYSQYLFPPQPSNYP